MRAACGNDALPPDDPPPLKPNKIEGLGNKKHTVCLYVDDEVTQKNCL